MRAEMFTRAAKMTRLEMKTGKKNRQKSNERMENGIQTKGGHKEVMYHEETGGAFGVT